MTLQLTITDAGRAELIQNNHLGFNAVTIVAVAIGDAQYVPSRTQTALVREVTRLTSIAGTAVGDGILHVTVRDESTNAYNVGEFGLITDKGTLFAVCSQPAADGWIIQKAAPSIMLLSSDVLLEDIDAEQIQFGDVEFINPPATTKMAGVVELADDAEAAAAENSRKALTPRGARKFLDADTTKEPAISAGSTSQFWRGDKTWADLATAVRGVVLTGLSTATSSAVAATDTLLAALGKLQAQITSLGNNKLDKTATAAAATKLATARTIGGVSFDGTANINLPGVNTAGNQNTSGNAGSATKLATARTLTIGSSGKTFDGTGNVSWSLAEIGAAALNHTHAYLPLTGGTLSGNLNAPAVAFTGITGVSISAGNGDNASSTVNNLKLTSWYGIGFSPSIANQTVPQGEYSHWFNVRNGNMGWRGVASGNGSGLTHLNASNLASGTVPAARLSGTYAINISGSAASCTGNAATATKLATARTIGGVSFDGTANINLPGVNTAGNQNTSGNAATATKLQTARTINGVAFDGTQNITITAEATAASVMSAIAAAAHDAVGTYVLAQQLSGTVAGPDHIVPGSALSPACAGGYGGNSTRYAGSWLKCGWVLRTGSGSDPNAVTLYRRIS